MALDRPRSPDRPEPPAVNTRVVVVTAIGFLVFVGISLFVLRIYYGDEINQSVFVPPKVFAKPQLQTDPAADLAKLRSEQNSRLNTYGWMDRDKGIVRIPIEEAMKRIVERSPDAYAPLEPASTAHVPADAGEGNRP